MPFLVDRCAGPREALFHPAGLDAVPVPELPFQILDRYEAAESRMKWHNVIILKIDLDESFPVVCMFFDLHAIEHIAREIEVVAHAEMREITRDVAWTRKEQPTPVLQW